MFMAKDFSRPDRLLSSLEGMPADDPISIETSRDGLPVIRVEQGDKKLYLGSKFNAAEDLRQVLDQAAKMLPNSTVIVFGLGNGEYIKKIISTFLNNNVLIVLEPNLNIIRSFLNGNLVKKFKRGDPFTLYHVTDDGIDTINRHLQNATNRSIKFIDHPGYGRAYPQLLKKVAAMVVDSQKNIILEDNTWDAFIFDWVDNPIKNMSHIPTAYAINDFAGKLKDRPAVIVSAGPSLSKNVHLIPQVKDKFAIIAGGRTLQTLLNIGVDPDFINIIDASKISFDLVDGVLPKANTTLVHYDRVPAAIFDQYHGRHIFYSDNPEYEKIIGRPIGHIITGSSVAHASLNYALLAGCNPIIFIGQDLAFTGERTHSDLATYDFEDGVAEGLKYASDNFDVEDVYGQPVKTNHLYTSFRTIIEDIIRVNPETTFINATQGGANIKGTKVMDLADVIKEYGDIEPHAIDYSQFEKIGHEEDFAAYKESLLDKYQGMHKEMVKAFEWSDKLLVCESAGLGANIQKHSKKLAKLETRMGRLVAVDPMLQSLLSSSFKRIRRNNELLLTGKETTREAALKAYERRTELYTAYKLASEYLIKALKKDMGLWTEQDEQDDKASKEAENQKAALPQDVILDQKAKDNMDAAIKDALKNWEDISDGNA